MRDAEITRDLFFCTRHQKYTTEDQGKAEKEKKVDLREIKK